MIDLNTLILMMVAVGNILIPFQNKRNAKTVKMSRIIIISTFAILYEVGKTHKDLNLAVF